MTAADGRGRRRAAGLALVLAVTLVHLGLSSELLASRLGAGAADTAPRRIDVAFVRELAQAAPPPGAPVPAVRRVRPLHPARPAAPEPAASAPEPEVPESVAAAASEPAPAVPEVAQAAALAASAASAPTAVAEAPPSPASAAASSPTAPAFDWPPSTRLSYALTGNYRGPVEGRAQVEWLRSGSHYQVRLEVAIGPGFAPLMSRRMTSDGELTDQGLAPRRYDEETKVALRDPRRATVFFEPDHVLLPDGRKIARLSGVQDTASQFVQMTWRFTTQPGLLHVGQLIDMPLALARRVDTWVYEVVGRELLPTPVGEIDTFHMKPRGEQRQGSELSAEMWFAPTLQYLPVRIRIRQDAEVYIDLLLDKLPQQSEQR